MTREGRGKRKEGKEEWNGMGKERKQLPAEAPVRVE